MSREADPKKRLAVALQYDRAKDDAPRVVASGRGAVAERIEAVAAAEGVIVRQDADLAEILSVVEIGREIPTEAFVAVAEVLSYVYRMNRDLGSGRGGPR